MWLESGVVVEDKSSSEVEAMCALVGVSTGRDHSLEEHWKDGGNGLPEYVRHIDRLSRTSLAASGAALDIAMDRCALFLQYP
eukprot:1696572-Prymnesium_polylepis.1